MFNAGTNILGFTTAGTERMRILAGGNIGIGTTTPTFQLQLSTDSAGKPTSNTWTIASDKRVKEDIQLVDLSTSYSIIQQLKLKQFQYTKDFLPSEEGKTFVGFIAQEVEDVLPQSVKTVKNEYYDDFKNLDVDQINKHLLGAVQFLMKKVEQLETEIKVLKQ